MSSRDGEVQGIECSVAAIEHICAHAFSYCCKDHFGASRCIVCVFGKPYNRLSTKPSRRATYYKLVTITTAKTPSASPWMKTNEDLLLPLQDLIVPFFSPPHPRPHLSIRLATHLSLADAPSLKSRANATAQCIPVPATASWPEDGNDQLQRARVRREAIAAQCAVLRQDSTTLALQSQVLCFYL